VLSDEGKRKMYDQTGSAEPNPFTGFENEDIFGSFRRGNGGGKRGHQA
jgi:DnaJ-class molecular chaperone